MPPKLDPIKVQHTIDLYQSGKTVEEIAALLGLHVQTIYGRLQRAGVMRSNSEASVIRWARDNAVDIDELISRHDAGASVKQLAFEFDITRKRVCNILERVGRDRRTASEANLIRFLDPEARGVTTRNAHLVRGFGNAQMTQAIEQLGVSVEREFLIENMNLDLALGDIRFAVEVHANASKPHSRASREFSRIEYLLSRGWRVLYIWLHPCVRLDWATCAQYAVSWFQASNGHPASAGEYRVIFGCGEFLAGATRNLDELSGKRPSHRCRKMP